MHSSSFNSEPNGGKSEAEVLLAVTTLVTEGRIPEKLGPKSKGFREGPHCFLSSQTNEQHICDSTNSLCVNHDIVREEVIKLWMQEAPLCIEVLLTCGCQEGDYFVGFETIENFILLESWNFNINNKRISTPSTFQVPQLVNAIRSQLYFSQITAWLTTQEENSKKRLTSKHLRYRIALPGETFNTAKFITNTIQHNFPPTDIGCNRVLNVSYSSLPRMSSFPFIQCPSCNSETKDFKNENIVDVVMVDDRMHTLCTLKGKHHCEDYEEVDNSNKTEKLTKFKRFRQNLKEEQQEPSTSTLNQINSLHQQQQQQKIEIINTNCMNDDDDGHYLNDLIYNNKEEDKSKLLLEAIERVGLRSPQKLQQQKKKNNERKQNLVTIDRPNLMNYESDSTKNNKRLIINKNFSLKDKEKCENLVDCANSKCGCDNVNCDKRKSDISNSSSSTSSSNNKFSIYVDKKFCDSPIPTIKHKKIKDISNILSKDKKNISRHLNFDNFQKNNNEAIINCDKSSTSSLITLEKEKNGFVPTAVEQAKFRKNLDNAASMVFHSRTGLPLTSSPAPVRKGKTCFDFDSSIDSVSAIKSALFPSGFSTDDDSESDGSLVSPCSPADIYLASNQKNEEEDPKTSIRWQKRRKGHSSSLLGSFEESVLNGRLEPVSTVHGFTAELGASGSFVPKHLIVPVTVFFYTLGDNDKISSPYLCHINLGKKGYCVPKRGTVQVTLFNPLGTVVKMFVIIYDLTDMPPNSQTFIRQRNLYMPSNCKDENIEWVPKWLKYLIHLRFVSSKSGKIYLHSDIRMIIFHKSDFDTATAHSMDLNYELRSFTLMPTNPRFSPRK